MNQNQQIRSINNDISVWDIVDLLIHKLHWLILSGIAFGMLVFLIVSFLITPTYESNVSFYVYNSSESVLHNGTINNNDLQAAENLAATYSKIMVSKSVLDAVLTDLGEESGVTRKDLSKMVEAKVISDTQLLEVIITSTDAEFSYKVANSFAKVVPNQIVRITKAGGVEVVDSPEIATEKSSPRTVFDTAIGIIVGVIVASVILIIKMLSNTTIYLPEDIDDLVGVTVLGQIPEIDVSDSKYTGWSLVYGGTIRYEEKEG